MSERCDGPEAPWPARPGDWNSEAASANACWYALCVKPRHEKAAAAALRFKGYEEFLPLYRSRRRWSDRFKEVELPLFAGYVFCRFDARLRVPVLTTPGVLRILGCGRESVAVPDSEIEALKTVVRSRLPAEPWPYLAVGCRIGVEDGPLRGIQGTLLEIKGRERLVLSVALLRRSIAVEVDRRWVTPLAKDAMSVRPEIGRTLSAGA